MSKRFNLVLAALLLAASAPVFAINRGDPAAGQKKSAACAGCHGPKGHSTSAQYPKLAGQYADYIVQALTAYKSGDRQNAIMNGMAANLSKEDMWDLAAYFSSQQGDLHTLPRWNR